MSNHSHIATVGDVISGVAVLGSLAGYLPDIAAAGALIWYAVQLYDRFNGTRFRGDD